MIVYWAQINLAKSQAFKPQRQGSIVRKRVINLLYLGMRGRKSEADVTWMELSSSCLRPALQLR